jgi:glycosyltransferase involved in cell wall biosynthesis
VSGDKRAPRVSVVIPTFNRSDLLKQAIASVLGQSLTDIEVLVSDNGSTDDTAAVVAAFDDDRLRHLPLEANVGMIANLDRCLTLGSAPYVLILHDDDVMQARNVEAKLAVADAHPEVAFVHSAFSFIDAGGQVTQQWMAWGLPIDPIETSETFIRRAFTSGSRVSPSGTLIRRSAIGDVHHEPEDKAANDMGLWLRIARHGSAGYLDEPLVALRRHAASLTVSSGVRTMAGGDEYAPTFETIAQMRLVMNRFAARFAGDPIPGAELRAMARKSTRSRLAGVVKTRAGPEAKRKDVFDLFVEASRIEPTLALSADGVELLATIVGGKSGGELVNRARPGLRSVRARLTEADGRTRARSES